MRAFFIVALSAFVAACGARTGLGLPEAGEGGEANQGGGAGAQGGGGAGGEGVGGVEQLSLGAQHSCLRTFAGDVFCWGNNSSGQLGTGDFEPSSVPVRVELDAPATFLATGTYHSCAILDDGQIRCWGRNDHGELGSDGLGDSPSPTPVSPVAAGRAFSVSLGEEHSCAIYGPTSEGALYCWGSNENGQLGVPTREDFVTTPLEVFEGVERVATGAFHTCFIDGASGTARCMGSNFELQCGVDGPSTVTEPVEVDGLDGLSPTAIQSGIGFHTCVHDGSSVACWGDNDEGQLGAGVTSPASLPLQVAGLGGSILGVAPGFAHTCALNGVGEVYCWGDDFIGQLGIPGNDTTAPTVPTLTGVTAVGSGTVHSCAYVSAEEIYCWGGNAFGQLGDGTTENHDAPVPVVLP